MDVEHRLAVDADTEFKLKMQRQEELKTNLESLTNLNEQLQNQTKELTAKMANGIRPLGEVQLQGIPPVTSQVSPARVSENERCETKASEVNLKRTFSSIIGVVFQRIDDRPASEAINGMFIVFKEVFKAQSVAEFAKYNEICDDQYPEEMLKSSEKTRTGITEQDENLPVAEMYANRRTNFVIWGAAEVNLPRVLVPAPVMHK
ncbi:unnamed protein product [Heligmosomoides polygyrus]|uniref:Uncharacterized protein n=1 Tax=Heligmosomoides polygyrus TaxID=6339 RepID=A0A3P8A721_HELPZ|nr:unnamed protein product [Heligmosomoides polygyrus]